MAKQKSDKKYGKFTVKIKNTPVLVAGELTHHLYEMVDNKEIHSVSIKDARKSPHSVDAFFEIVVEQGIPYALGKAADIPQSYVVRKVIRSWKKWREKNPQTKMDMYINDEDVY